VIAISPKHYCFRGLLVTGSASSRIEWSANSIRQRRGSPSSRPLASRVAARQCEPPAHPHGRGHLEQWLGIHSSGKCVMENAVRFSMRVSERWPLPQLSRNSGDASPRFLVRRRVRSTKCAPTRQLSRTTGRSHDRHYLPDAAVGAPIALMTHTCAGSDGPGSRSAIAIHRP
jgi:hypothetical protein